MNYQEKLRFKLTFKNEDLQASLFHLIKFLINQNLILNHNNMNIKNTCNKYCPFAVVTFHNSDCIPYFRCLRASCENRLLF